MGLSTRVFGFSSLAMLLPEALCTVGAVALLHATVRRFAGHATALAAALALALTPVTVAIGRVNNPDALLVLLLVAAGYLLVRALESGRTKHLAWCGVVVGLAFMTKMLQGWMVLPALAATYLWFGPAGAWRRAGSSSPRSEPRLPSAQPGHWPSRCGPAASRTSAARRTGRCGT